MLNKSEIMKAAWARYHSCFHTSKGHVKNFQRQWFSMYLKEAWADAKEAQRLAANPQARVEKRISELKQAIANTQYLPSGMNAEKAAAPYRNELVELEKLAA